MTSFDRRHLKPTDCRARSGSIAVHRGSSGIHLDGGGQNLTADQDIPLIGRPGFEVELDGLGLLDVCHGLFDGVALRLTSLQFGALGVISVLVLSITTLALRAITSVYPLAIPAVCTIIVPKSTVPL